MFSITRFYKKALSKIVPFILAIPSKLCYVLELHLFITILASPIFLSWGLPISLLSPIGNLIFAPWLTAFLTLSSLLFFFQIIALDNTLIIYLLEKLNQLFLAILDLADKTFMISCACPLYFILFLVPFMLFFLIKLKKTSNIYIRVLILFIFSNLLFFSFKYLLAPKSICEHIHHKKQKVLLIKHNKKTALIDYGAFSEGRNPQSWVRYQLISELLKRGIDHLDCLIISNPSGKLFEGIIELLKNVTIKHIYIPKWTGTIPYTGWKCWKTVLNLKKQRQLKITLLEKPLTLKLDKNFIITINLLEQLIHKSKLTYKKLEIEAHIDQKIINSSHSEEVRITPFCG